MIIDRAKLPEVRGGPVPADRQRKALRKTLALGAAQDFQRPDSRAVFKARKLWNATGFFSQFLALC
jgi:hypothetical protein